MCLILFLLDFRQLEFMFDEQGFRQQVFIMILGDHGSRFSDVRYYEHPESASPQFLDERFGAFAAAYLPAGGDSILANPVTLVNVFRYVLSYYFGAQLPPLPNAHYVSGDRPYRFRKVELPKRGAADP